MVNCLLEDMARAIWFPGQLELKATRVVGRNGFAILQIALDVTCNDEVAKSDIFVDASGDAPRHIEPGVEVTSIVSAGGQVRGVEVNASGGRSRTADLVVLAAGAWSANIQNVSPSPPVVPQRATVHRV